MRRTTLLLILIWIFNYQYGQIIADHTVIDEFDNIPAQWIDSVKKMLVFFPGESHSEGYRTGMELLEAENSVYACNISTGEAYTDQHVRVEETGYTGEDLIFTWYSYPVGARPDDWKVTWLKDIIKDYNDNNHPFSAVGFAWCNDMATEDNVSANVDPVYGVHWYGRSAGGIDGNKAWGLDADDYSVTGNRVNLSTYFGAMEEVMAYCATNSPKTKIVFTTGPVDIPAGEWNGECGYQGHLKHEAIRNYVKADPSRILFDYADILCYDNDGTPNTQTWNGHTYPLITASNLGNESIGHIDPIGVIRLAKAQWWLLARIAGWDGGTSPSVPVTGITVSGAGGSTVINTDNGTLQLSAAVTPANATNKTVTWSVQNGTGEASISTSGLVTAISNGTVTARATANDGSGVYGTLVITISNQVIPVTGITVTGAGGATVINTDNGTLQLSVTVTPANATDKTVTWSLQNGTGQASISTSGLVTAISNGKVTARATANDGSGVFGTLIITITNQVIPVTGITVTGAGGATAINTDDGTLQLSVTVTPANATDKTVTWSVQNGTGQASISTSGLVTAISNGTVTARATANDGSGVYGTLVITITNQVIPVAGISVSGAGGATSITTDNGSLQLIAAITPSNATNKTVTWTIENGSGEASVNGTGLVTAIKNGTVTARATASDGSGVSGTLTITITNQVIPVTGITVTGAGGATVINTDNGTLQLNAVVTPTDASDKTVTWSVTNGTGEASINTAGLVTAIKNGTVTARATAGDGSGVYGTLTLTITNQLIPVAGISVTGAGGSTTITTDNGTLQLSAVIIPADASDKTVTWSIQNGTGQATISTSGQVTAIANGTVTARAAANDGSGVFGTLAITISNQVIPVTGITVSGAGGATSINTDNGTLQLNAVITPSDATDKTVTWSLQNGTGQATISTSGLVTAIKNGTVTAKATANDGSGVYGILTITISNQLVPVTGITLNGAGGSTIINTDDGTLQINAVIAPADATDKTVNWSLQNGTGQAIINASGLVTAIEH